jgi:EmrB/QacA subfamily drug resistance transporter
MTETGTGTIHQSSGADDVAVASHRWRVLAIVCLAQLMITLDITIVNIALPHAQRALGFSNAQRQWVITAYALAFGSLLLVSGRIADRIGRRTAILIGLVVFGAGSALGGAAPNFGLLVAARVIQGVGGSLLAPAALATMTVTFTDPKERARAFSVFGGIGAVGGAVGLLAGGVLTEHLNWRWTLYVNLGIAAVTLLGALAVMSHDAPSEKRDIDVLGTGLVTVGLFGLVFGFSRAETDGWGAPITWGTLLASAALLAGFAWWQTRATSPLLPLRVLLDRDRGASFTALMVVNVGMFGVFLFLTYYLQASLGYSPVKTGLAFLPLIGGTITGSVVALNVSPRYMGPRLLVPIGMLIGAANLGWLTQLGTHSGYWSAIFPPLLLLGIGLGMVFPRSINLSTARLDSDDAGVAGAAVNTTQQVGGSLGIAVLSTLSASAVTSYLKHRDATDPSVFAHATLHGYAVAYSVAAAIFVVGALVVGALYRPGLPDELIESDDFSTPNVARLRVGELEQA